MEQVEFHVCEYELLCHIMVAVDAIIDSVLVLFHIGLPLYQNIGI